MGDDYTYPQKPLPVKQLLGGNTGTNVEIAGLGNLPFSTSSSLSTPSPFANPDGYGGGGGGGGGGLLYITDALSLKLGEGPAGNANNITISSSATGDNFIELTTLGISGKAILNVGDISLSQDEVETGSGQINLKEINVCHMGVSGLRQFLCGDAYAP